MALPGNEKRSELTPAQWQRAETLFHGALDQPAADRAAWVDRQCGDDTAVRAEVLSLLGSDAAAGTGFVEKQLAPARAQLLEPAITRAGPYRLVRELGHGGMGTVYLAERDDEQYTSQVAVKLVRPGLDTDLILSRFYRERQTLARLQHPNIARLLDGGTTPAGMPYIVMEYIDGLRITDHCRERQLSLRECLTLFLGVCAAVDYAHRQFVVHRDLKPGNILVDGSGTVKLLDFGICKLLQSQSQFDEVTIDGAPPLTPDYASPEQILGEPITVASDVYSAAAVLYELLTGVKPHKIESYTIRGIERGICHTEIVKPSEAAGNRQLRGDLDTILLRALDKNPSRRYPSMEAFAADLSRYLNHEPVLARPDSTAYRAAKFVRRHRLAAGASAAVLLSMTAGIVSSVRSARIANENLRMVRQMSNAFVVDVYDSIRDLPGATNARELIAKTGVKYLDAVAQSARGDRQAAKELAGAYRRIADVRGNARGSNLGNSAEALRSYQKALELWGEWRPGEPDSPRIGYELITVHHRMGSIHLYAGDHAKNLASYQEARRIGEAMLASYPGDNEVSRYLADTSNLLAESLRRSGDFPGARASSLRALSLLESMRAERTGEKYWRHSMAQAYTGAGQSEVRMGRLREALDLYRKAAAEVEQLVRQEPDNGAYQRNLMFDYAHIGDVLGNPNMRNLGDRAGAAEAYEKVVAIARRLHEADPADLRARADYGIALSRAGATTSAKDARRKVELFQKALELLGQANSANSKNVINRVEHASIQNLLGDAYLALGNRAQAEQTYQTGLAESAALFPSRSGTAWTAFVLMAGKLGELTARRGDRAGSLRLGEKALQLAKPAPERPEVWQRVLTPRAHAANGHILAALYAGPARRAEDRAAALASLTKALESYRQLEKTDQFSAQHRTEMEAVKKRMEELQ